MTNNFTSFADQIRAGIPSELPPKRQPDEHMNRAPKRKDILNGHEKRLAIKNALRYFPSDWHPVLANEFAEELKAFGRIYMYRFKPKYELYARPLSEYPAQNQIAGAIMLMIQNNLDPKIAQHPEELITYGGNGSVFQNWAQYLLTMKYLSEMKEDQTLHMYSGHPMGLFPSNKDAPRVVITNGLMIPNYSSSDDWEKYNALGVTQYGQMTAGSFMYIGPQGIVHGTTITVMNAFRKILDKGDSPKGKVFLTAGLGGMSGAQPKAGNIVECITVCAEVNEQAAKKRHEQGWVDELFSDIELLAKRVRKAKDELEVVSLAFIGNVVDVWEYFYDHNIYIHVGSDQTSLHNPWSGGYYPVGMSYDDANSMITEDPSSFKKEVQKGLKRHAASVLKHAKLGTYFFDYGNAFLLEASRSGAEIMDENEEGFVFPSYVEDILGPMCFDYGFGPFRWVCTSGNLEDLQKTDQIAAEVLEEIKKDAPDEITQQLSDNIKWIKEADKNNLVVGSKARILYADSEGRIKIASAFNDAIKSGVVSEPIVLGRDHHDTGGTDSPYRETANIYDGSKYTADMSIHSVIGDSFRGASWISIHNGGGVGWGEVMNGGFGLLLDGSDEAQRKLESMLFFDVNNGIARRSWARNEEASFAIKREMERNSSLKVTMPEMVEEELLSSLF